MTEKLMDEQRAATTQARKLIEKFENAMKDAGIYLISKPIVIEDYDAESLHSLKRTLNGICPESMLSYLKLKKDPQTFGIYVEKSLKGLDEGWIYNWRLRLMTEEEIMQRKMLKEKGIEQ